MERSGHEVYQGVVWGLLLWKEGGLGRRKEAEGVEGAVGM